MKPSAVTERGGLVRTLRRGEAPLLARFEGAYAATTVTVMGDRAGFEWREPEKWNRIDEFTAAKWRRLKILPSELSADADFLRRVHLDLTGLPPSAEEVRAFLADPSPDKRRSVIGEILGHPAYADHWATKWADLVRPNPDRVGLKSVLILDQWLRRSFRENQPYDRFVSEIRLAEGTHHRDGPAVIYRDRREPAERATMFAQLFLGTRLDCARCHNHPNEK
ncbi:MAG: DUF1549 domain-containing protein, partial [Opitutaceae bacterium]